MTNQESLFPGFEIEGDFLQVKPLSGFELQLSAVKADRKVQVGDEFEVVTRYRITDVKFGGDGADDAGNLKGQFSQRFYAHEVKTAWKVTRYLTAEEREAAWAEAHGATA
jgi:hypothetical protein